MTLGETAELAQCGLVVTAALLLAVAWVAFLDLRDWQRRCRRRSPGRRAPGGR